MDVGSPSSGRARHAAPVLVEHPERAVDPLTGLPGREALVSALAGLERGPEPTADVAPGAFLHVALDHFRDTNRRIGRSAADLVLVEIARRLRAEAGAVATVVRLGGDEFGVLIPHPAGAGAVTETAQAILRSLAAPVHLADPARDSRPPRGVVSVGASVGIASVGDGGPCPLSLDELLVRADAAAHRAKEHGRGRAEHFSVELDTAHPAGGPLHDRHAMESRLRAAIDDGSLEVHLQPQVELPSGLVTAYEALARWDDELLGPIPPDTFIPLAEQTGLILDLGAWVLRTACHQAVALSTGADVGAGPTVAVNVSPIQLAQPGFVGLVTDALAEAGLPAHRLCLELTETAAVEDLGTTSERLGLLRDRGIEIALDDFGTGYSSLTLLRSMPLTVVKIDRSFVASVSRSTQDAVLVRMVIEAAHSFGLQVCAEGVEEADQVAQLVAMGCDSAQGWFFGRPQPLDRYLERPADVVGTTGFDPLAPPPIPLGAADAMVMVTAPDNTILYVSSTSTLLVGWTPQQMVGTLAVDYALPSALGTDTPLPPLGTGVVTYPVLHRDGTERFIETDSRGLLDDEGTLVEVISVCHDVSAATRARAALDASEARFQHVFDSAPIGMALSGLDGRIWHANDVYAAMLGYAPDDLVGKEVDALTHPQDRDADAVHLSELDAGTVTRHEVAKRYLHADGRAVPVVVHASLVAGSGSIPGYVMAHIVQAGPPE